MNSNSNFEKAGSLKTCPACGEILKPMSLKCEACCNDISTAKNVQSVDAFFKLLSTIDDINKRINIISDYPVPSSQEDIIQFLAICFSHAKVLTKDQESELDQHKAQQMNKNILSSFGINNKNSPSNPNELSELKKEYDVWAIKKDEVLMKAKAYHYKDVEFIKMIDRMNEEYLDSLKKLRKGLSKKVKTFLTLIPILILLFGFIFYMAGQEKQEEENELKKLEKIEQTINADIANKKYDEAILLVDQLVWTWKLNFPDSKKKAQQYDEKRKSLKETIERIKNEHSNK